MQDELFAQPPPSFAATRQEALQRLEAFVPLAGRYGALRNHVLPGHPHVSRLSPAIRHRLILESECAAAPLRRYAPSTVEKFTQEVCWRRYWKSWLSLRPQVWTEYLEDLKALREDPRNGPVLLRAERCAAGEGPVAIMNHFARELLETGYLHNHARMWFAGWWIHVERLPWQLGADLFFRHLLDADPASNTLSWRWVAGLQTPGKTYLPRRSNLEKYLPPGILATHREGLERLEHPQALSSAVGERPAITRPSLPETPPPAEGPTGIWIHEEDLLIERGPLEGMVPDAILACADPGAGKDSGRSPLRTAWLRSALDDAARRAETAYGVPVDRGNGSSVLEAMLEWVGRRQLRQVVAMRPEVGPLDDQIEAVRIALSTAGVRLVLHDRPEDLALRPLATGGFFGFWEKLPTRFRSPA